MIIFATNTCNDFLFAAFIWPNSSQKKDFKDVTKPLFSNHEFSKKKIFIETIFGLISNVNYHNEDH